VHRKEFAGLVSTGTFVYTDLDENVFTNSVPALVPIDFPAIDTISSGGSFTFQWQGDAVGEDETVTLSVDGTQQENFEVFTTILEGETQLVLGADKLGNLGAGAASAVLTRSYYRNSVDEGTSEGGRIASSYVAEKSLIISE
jgi:hypothetical protein